VFIKDLEYLYVKEETKFKFPFPTPVLTGSGSMGLQKISISGPTGPPPRMDESIQNNLKITNRQNVFKIDCHNLYDIVLVNNNKSMKSK
jgi:hypothetical protein